MVPPETQTNGPFVSSQALLLLVTLQVLYSYLITVNHHVVCDASEDRNQV